MSESPGPGSFSTTERGGADEPDPLMSMLLRARPGELGPDVVAELLRRPDWHERAACRGMGTDAFFIGQGGDAEPAYAICSGCEVVEPCRAAGDGEHGVWGGTSKRQRERERRVVRSSGRRPAPEVGEAA